MTTNELSKAVALAQSKVHLPRYIGPLSVDCPFLGFILDDFQPVTCTIVDLAALVRHQCMNLDGTIDNVALQEIATAGKTKFTIVGLGDDTIEAELPHWYSGMAI